MSPEELRRMIEAGESLDVELKGESKRPLNDRDLVEAVVCLANRAGQGFGYLMVGVEDDGRVTGARPRHEGSQTDPRRVQALIANRTRPSLTCRAELVRLDEKDVLVLEVPASAVPVGTGDGTYLRRALGARGEPQCLPYHFHEMQARQADQGSLDYSSLVLPKVRWEDLDPLEFDRFRRSIRESRGLGDRALADLTNLELAKALGAVEANGDVRGVRVLGLLLFGTEEALAEWLPSHEIAFQVLSGARVEVNDLFRWPLLRAMEEILARFRARNQEQEILVDFRRIGIPDYSEVAFREAVANALIHRDYTRLGAVHIQWWPERIEISNPGGFPEGVRLDNLLVTPPRPRNPLLADAFKRAGLVERTGRGIDTIFWEQLRNGRPEPDYGRSTTKDVVLALPGGDADREFVRQVAERGLAGEPFELDALRHFWREWESDKTGEPPGRLPAGAVTGQDGLILVSIGGESILPVVNASLESLGLQSAPVLVDFSLSEYVPPDQKHWEAEARQIRNQVRGLIEDPRFTRLHLFYRGPVVLAPLLGALIAHAKPLIVYYYQDGRYEPAYTLDRRFLTTRQ